MMSQALPALCWMTFTFLVSDCSHAQLLEARECQAAAETAVRHQPKLCKASAEHVLSCLSRIRTEAWSGRRDSNSRHRPWEGRALPTELLPHGKPDFSIALPQFLAHRPDDHDQLRDARGGPLDLGGVEDIDRDGLVKPDPAAIPGLQVELLAQARFDYQ